MIRPVQALETLSEAGSSGAGSRTMDCLADSPVKTAVVEGVEGSPALRRRLLEIGFTEGCKVRFVMATPFGDPLVFSLRGASIALRKSEARCVRVRA